MHDELGQTGAACDNLVPISGLDVGPDAFLLSFSHRLGRERCRRALDLRLSREGRSIAYGGWRTLERRSIPL